MEGDGDIKQPPKNVQTGSPKPPEPPMTPEIEVDEFGLPVRRRRKPSPSPAEDTFEEAVETQGEELGNGGREPKSVDVTPRSSPKAVRVFKSGWKEERGLDVRDRVSSIEQSERQANSPKIADGKWSESGSPARTRGASIKSVIEGLIPDTTSPDGSIPVADTPVENSKAEEELVAPVAPETSNHNRNASKSSAHDPVLKDSKPVISTASEWSHQQLVNQEVEKEEEPVEEEPWQEMPAYAPFDIYNDDGKIVAREAVDDEEEVLQYGTLGGAGKGYTRVQLDEDAQSATSLDENTAYLFKDQGATTNVADEDDEDQIRDARGQMAATKELLTEGQRIAYVGIVRLSIIEMIKEMETLGKTKGAKKIIEFGVESLQMWSQKVMMHVFNHMEIEAAEQIMIEQLAQHGVQADDLTPALMQNARVKNPMKDEEASSGRPSMASPRDSVSSPRRSIFSSPRDSISSPRQSQSLMSPTLPSNGKAASTTSFHTQSSKPDDEAPPPYDEHLPKILPEVKAPAELPDTKSIDIDIRWTILCDLFLILIADSTYDSRSRQLLERVGSHLSIDWLDICRFEKRVTDALEMQEAASKENWNEDEHMASRKKMARNKRLVFMGLATVGGGLVIGLSAGLLAPVIGAGLAAGFTTIGVAGTSGFLAGAGGAAIVTTTGVLTGGTIAVRAADRRTGAVQTFEYRPLHNNKRVNLIVTVSGWMNGKVDDVRLPFSTVDPIMGDIYSIYWEPEMLQSMGQTISILATEALTQTLQQVLGSTILVALMAAIQLPVVLTKLAYLIDNPWTVSMARADLAGLILADSLTDRNLGARPITLVGFSLGSRVIYACLRELAKKGQTSLIQNVYLFGAPIVSSKDEFLKCKTVVSGRFVNGYATNDWILGYLFRATGGGISKVAGLAPIDGIPGIENFNVSEWVPGHMSYRAAMPRLLREVGWQVESDEFTEIEDPDPDKHDERQRELINEIEEARKQLEEKSKKKSRFSFFGRNKKTAEKKDWEMYDERLKGPAEPKEEDLAKQSEGVLFDVNAIMAEVVDLSAQGIEVKQLESTLPPMKLDLNSPPALRTTKSFNDSIDSASPHKSEYSSPPTGGKGTHSPFTSNGKHYDIYEDGDIPEEGDISMTFDSPHPLRTTSRSEYHEEPEEWPASYKMPVPPSDFSTAANDTNTQRPSLKSHATSPAVMDFEHNAWADDDDDFGKEKEITMTFG
ncbi:hypothetical protein Vi05172_g5 [Venturia inaequalis]|uniref:DUF726-domain-containing protein n=2 Tax=Venturia inaequalis TaxID=5025 RepID=A0A8H3ZHT3_VENIN|nr:hypothetical protein EG327_008875 [Venturia inaequalis]RDI89460.1 hypothetical protein Vi05172_g5 [Venturia inaequalis]